MALLDAETDPASFTIDAIDLSTRAIEQARLGCYGRNAFRGTATEFRARHFTPTRDGWLLDERVRACVQFSQSNLVEPAVDTGIRCDFVFCRNVLIYFDRDAQDRVIRSLDARLADDGMLFVGPAETGVAMRHGMRSARVPLAFAFHREAPPRRRAMYSRPGRRRRWRRPRRIGARSVSRSRRSRRRARCWRSRRRRGSATRVSRSRRRRPPCTRPRSTHGATSR